MKIALTLSLLTFILCANIVLADNSVIFSDNKLKISIIRYEPSPASPGSYFDLWLRAEALYSAYSNNDLQNLKIELTPEFPFFLSSDENAVKDIGTLKEGSIAEFKYRINVDKDAIEGTNNLKFKYTSTVNTGGLISPSLGIEIQSLAPILLIKNIESIPTQIPPGSTAKVNMTIENLANSLLKDITLSLNLSSTETPISPIGSVTEKRIVKINALSEENVVFDVIVSADAESKVYKIPIKLIYFDALGNEYTKTDIIGLVVGDKPDITVNIEKSEIIKAGSSGEVTFNIINKGTVGVKFLNVELKPSNNYEILSTFNEIYVGTLDSDDFETAEFNIYIKNKGELTFPLILEYRDANNNKYTQDENVTLRIYSSLEVRKYNLGENGNSKIILILVVIVIAYFGYKRWKKKKALK